MSKQPLVKVLREYKRILMAVPGVTEAGYGLYRGQPCIKVFVSRNPPRSTIRLPSSIEGHTVIVEEAGELRSVVGA